MDGSPDGDLSADHSDDERLAELIAALPEQYQPLYGLPSGPSSRPAELARTDSIVDAVAAIETVVGRPLRIADLGSAQGYFSLSLAARGHSVVGIDYLLENVNLARHLAVRNPELDVTFLHESVESFIPSIASDQFDVVLGLSVLHHLVYQNGTADTRRLVGLLADKVPFGIFEMATHEEPVYWAEAQPADPRVVLAEYPFVRRLTDSPTHLSQVERPLLYCSTSHFWVNGRPHRWTSYQQYSHAGAQFAQFGKRRYFEDDDVIIKITAQFEDDIDLDVLDEMRNEATNEGSVIEVLRDLGHEVPTLLELVSTDDEVILARTRYPGLPLHKLELAESNAIDVFGQVLHELARLEELGFHHHDLRQWNVIVGDGAAHVIDLGQLREVPGDVMWPHSPAYSLIVFASTLFAGQPDQTGLSAPRAPVGRPTSFPDPVRRVLHQLLREPNDRRVMRDAAAAFSDDEAPALTPTPAEEWLFALGDRSTVQGESLRAQLDVARHDLMHNANMAYAFQAVAEESEARAVEVSNVASASDQRALLAESAAEAAQASEAEAVQRLVAAEANHAAVAAELIAERDGLAQRLVEREAELGELDRDRAASRTELDRIQSSVSWRITRPLRAIRGGLSRRNR